MKKAAQNPEWLSAAGGFDFCFFLLSKKGGRFLKGEGDGKRHRMREAAKKTEPGDGPLAAGKAEKMIDNLVFSVYDEQVTLRNEFF